MMVCLYNESLRPLLKLQLPFIIFMQMKSALGLATVTYFATYSFGHYQGIYLAYL